MKQTDLSSQKGEKKPETALDAKPKMPTRNKKKPAAKSSPKSTKKK